MSFAERLAAVRATIKAQKLDGFLVPHADEHLGEYLPASAERLAWLTGFTGSAGTAIVLADQAAVWSDGRYVLQLATQTDGALWQRLHLMETPPQNWAAERLGSGVLGYDPWLISEDGLRPFREAGVTLRAAATNPIDANWADRPAPPPGPAMPHGLDYAGESSAAKRERLAAQLSAQKQDAAIITDPASLAWVLNIRGNDVESTPFALGFGLLHADQRFDLFMDGAKLPGETRAWLGNQVASRGARRASGCAVEIGRQARVRRFDQHRGLVRRHAPSGRRHGRQRGRSLPCAQSPQERNRTEWRPQRASA